jgi:hypothetical protein
MPDHQRGRKAKVGEGETLGCFVERVDDDECVKDLMSGHIGRFSEK